MPEASYAQRVGGWPAINAASVDAADGVKPLRSLSSVSHRAHPDAQDRWDGDWVCAAVRIRVGGFSGDYEAMLRTEELEQLGTDLARLHAELRGTATFDSTEEWLARAIHGDGRGHFRAVCEARDDAGVRNVLRFVLEFDQTAIPGMLAALDAVSKELPAR